MARQRKKLGEILVGWGAVSADVVDGAVAKARTSGKRIGDMLIELGAVNEEMVAKALANQFGLEYVDLASSGIASQVDPKLIPDDLIKKHLVLPLAKTNGRLTLIIHDPLNLELQDMLRFRLKSEIETR
ncbi:MAG TPA: hypothetical protein VEB22_03300, partial [Phycisphaerales bacterium]|nr:hypothetical protein [Phycisphaerales bacterium]